MKKIAFLLLFLAARGLYGQALISDFSSIGTQAFDPFNGNWNGGSPVANQFIQSADFITIAPVNAGNPQGDGSFDAILDGTTPIDFSSISQLSLVARVNSGNQIGSVVIEVRDSSFDLIGTSTFTTASLTSSFTTVMSPFVVSGPGIASDATYWRLAGDGVAGNNARMSFDNLSAIPEPSVIALAGVSLISLGLTRRRRLLPTAH